MGMNIRAHIPAITVVLTFVFVLAASIFVIVDRMNAQQCDQLRNQALTYLAASYVALDHAERLLGTEAAWQYIFEAQTNTDAADAIVDRMKAQHCNTGGAR